MNKGQERLVTQAGKSYVEDSQAPASVRLKFALLGLLCSVIAEAARVLVRDRFGKKGINFTKVWCSGAILFGVGMAISETTNDSNIGFQAMMVAGVGFWVPIVAYWRRWRAKEDTDFQGCIGGNLLRDDPNKDTRGLLQKLSTPKPELPKHVKEPTIMQEAMIFIAAGVVFDLACYFSDANMQ